MLVTRRLVRQGDLPMLYENRWSLDGILGSTGILTAPLIQILHIVSLFLQNRTVDVLAFRNSVSAFNFLQSRHFASSTVFWCLVHRRVLHSVPLLLFCSDLSNELSEFSLCPCLL